MKNKIHVTVKNQEDLYDSFNKKMISSSFNDYLVKSSMYIKRKEMILQIQGISSKKDQENFVTILQEYYENKALLLMKRDHLDDLKRFFLLLLGIGLIFLSSLLGFLLSEIFLVAGWVAIWEMVYDLMFKEVERKREIQIYKALSTCKIFFES